MPVIDPGTSRLQGDCSTTELQHETLNEPMEPVVILYCNPTYKADVNPYGHEILSGTTPRKTNKIQVFYIDILINLTLHFTKIQQDILK